MDNNNMIKRYSSRYKEKLKGYLIKTHPRFSEKYVDYIVDNAESSIDDNNSFLVLNDEDNIVGTHMLYNTRAVINGNVINTAWGHDTYLNENLRHSFGLDFVVTINSEGHFGIGLSEVNRKLHRKMRSTSWDNLYNYCFPTACLPLAIIFRAQCVRVKKLIKIKQGTFSLCTEPNSVRILNDGYWNRDICDIDFVRDELFLKKRFFTNKVHHYYLYQLDGENCYFVVRYVKFKHIPTLFVVDYRYDNNYKEQFQMIIKAVSLLANKSKLGLVLLMSSDKHTDSLLSKKRLLLKRSTDFIASRCLGLNNKMTTFVTAADSDADFIRG